MGCHMRPVSVRSKSRAEVLATLLARDLGVQTRNGSGEVAMYPRESPCSLPVVQALADLTEPRTLEGVRSLPVYILAGMLAGS